MTAHCQTNTLGRHRLVIAALVLTCLGLGDPCKAEPTARELFVLRGVDDATWSAFAEGVPLADEEIEPLCQVLLAVRGFRRSDIERWADRPWPATLPANAVSLRGQFFFLAGRVRQVESISVPADAPAHVELPRYYRCQIELGPDDAPSETRAAIVYAMAVPNEWLHIDELDEPVSTRAVLLKTEIIADAQDVPVFAARRLAWHPDTPLGQLGMDVGLLDTVTDNQPLGAGDRECFYQLLGAVADDVARSSTDTSTSAVALFNEVDEIRGDRVWLHGWTRRITRIEVDDADVAARFGLDHYFQLEMFTNDSQRNPIVCCLRELPDGVPTGDKIQEDISIAGFMMKKWAYRGEMASAQRATDDGHVTRLAPLVIARTIEWHPRARTDHSRTSGIVAACVFAVVFFFIITAVWRTGKHDQTARHKRSAGGGD